QSHRFLYIWWAPLLHDGATRPQCLCSLLHSPSQRRRGGKVAVVSVVRDTQSSNLDSIWLAPRHRRDVRVEKLLARSSKDTHAKGKVGDATGKHSILVDDRLLSMCA